MVMIPSNLLSTLLGQWPFNFSPLQIRESLGCDLRVCAAHTMKYVRGKINGVFVLHTVHTDPVLTAILDEVTLLDPHQAVLESYNSFSDFRADMRRRRESIEHFAAPDITSPSLSRSLRELPAQPVSVLEARVAQLESELKKATYTISRYQQHTQHQQAIILELRKAAEVF
jgi:hypothetical protein